MTARQNRKDFFAEWGREIRDERRETYRALREIVRPYDARSACEMLEQVMQELRAEQPDLEDDRS